MNMGGGVSKGGAAAGKAPTKVQCSFKEGGKERKLSNIANSDRTKLGRKGSRKLNRESSKNQPDLALVDIDEDELAPEDGQLTNAIVKIFTTHCRPDYSIPWTTMGQEASISSGFAFKVRACSSIPKGLRDRRLLLTNAHCVEDAAVVQVRRRGSGTRYVATVLAVANDCDLALLTVDEDEFWEGMEQLELVPGSNPPRPGESVTIVGFPTGGDNTSVTQGVVSRLDLYDYLQGGKKFLAIQVDAAINGGNSGGPALNKAGKCVGIAFQSDCSEDVENQGQIIPTEIIVHFLADYVKNGRYTGFPHAGFHVQQLESAALRAFFGLKKGQTGVRVLRVQPTSPAQGKIQVGDILTKVDKHEIGNDGNASYRFGERLPMDYLFHRKFVGESIGVSVIRDGKPLSLELELAAEASLVPVRSCETPQYYIAGGLVFVPLTLQFFNDEFPDVAMAPTPLLAAITEGVKQRPSEEVVVLTRVLAHKINVGYEDLENRRVLKFQDTAVANLRELAQRLEEVQGDDTVEYLKLELDGGELVVLRRDETVAALPEVLVRNLVAARGKVLAEDGVTIVKYES